jgi:hypothetical protein
MAGYRTFEAISRVALSWVKRNTDVLIQLLQIGELSLRCLGQLTSWERFVLAL